VDWSPASGPGDIKSPWPSF